MENSPCHFFIIIKLVYEFIIELSDFPFRLAPNKLQCMSIVRNLMNITFELLFQSLSFNQRPPKSLGMHVKWMDLAGASKDFTIWIESKGDEIDIRDKSPIFLSKKWGNKKPECFKWIIKKPFKFECTFVSAPNAKKTFNNPFFLTLKCVSVCLYSI